MVSGSSPSSLLSRADLSAAIPDNSRKLVHKVAVTQKQLQLTDHIVFYHLAEPPDGHFTKGDVLFLHGQSFNGSTWMENDTLRVMAAIGFRCIAPDMPGGGKTRGPAVPNEHKPAFIRQLKDGLGLKEISIVCASMSAPYVFPLLDSPWLLSVVAIAPSNTHQLDDVVSARTPVLVLYGEKDTSLGPTAASNLQVLPNSRAVRIPGAGHAAYLGNPIFFQNTCFNFLELIRSYSNS